MTYNRDVKPPRPASGALSSLLKQVREGQSRQQLEAAAKALPDLERSPLT
jgi:hypothetical protein